MKVIVAGGRDFNPTEQDRVRLKNLLVEIKATDIVCGEAKGADSFGKEVGVELGLNIISCPADWKNLDVSICKIKERYDGTKYNALAGFNRNQQMADIGDVLIAFKGGNGTDDMISRMEKLNKPVYRL